MAKDLRPGYELYWDGEYSSIRDAQASLVPGILPAVVIILFIIVMLLNVFRPPIIIVLTIPFVLIGITGGPCVHWRCLRLRSTTRCDEPCRHDDQELYRAARPGKHRA